LVGITKLKEEEGMKKRTMWLCMILLLLAALTPLSAAASGIEGSWNVSFNGYPGVMEIKASGGAYAGRFNLQAHGVWETMLDMTVAGNYIYFRRASADQRYIGVIAGDGMSGAFTQGGSGNYPWKAEKKAAEPAANIAGSWDVSFNSYLGVMEITAVSGGYTGRFNLQAHGVWETMLDLRVTGGQIYFRRANADQRYTGIVSGNNMTGTFSQGGSGSYPWKADRK